MARSECLRYRVGRGSIVTDGDDCQRGCWTTVIFGFARTAVGFRIQSAPLLRSRWAIIGFKPLLRVVGTPELSIHRYRSGGWRRRETNRYRTRIMICQLGWSGYTPNSVRTGVRCLSRDSIRSWYRGWPDLTLDPVSLCRHVLSTTTPRCSSSRSSGVRRRQAVGA